MTLSLLKLAAAIYMAFLPATIRATLIARVNDGFTGPEAFGVYQALQKLCGVGAWDGNGAVGDVNTTDLAEELWNRYYDETGVYPGTRQDVIDLAFQEITRARETFRAMKDASGGYFGEDGPKTAAGMLLWYNTDQDLPTWYAEEPRDFLVSSDAAIAHYCAPFGGATTPVFQSAEPSRTSWATESPLADLMSISPPATITLRGDGTPLSWSDLTAAGFSENPAEVPLYLINFFIASNIVEDS